MKLLITGGAGFIGSALVRMAIAEGSQARPEPHHVQSRRTGKNLAAAIHSITHTQHHKVASGRLNDRYAIGSDLAATI
jgi:nucleoside-diphosphate-sugar epimerase